MTLEKQHPALADLKLHHVGVVVESIEEKRSVYGLLGYQERTAVVHDPVQTAYVQFFQHPGADHYLELVAPDGPESKLARASVKKYPLNHLCYSVTDIAGVCQALEQEEWRILCEPVPAVAFDQRRIAWVSSPDLLIVEFVERGPAGAL